MEYVGRRVREWSTWGGGLLVTTRERMSEETCEGTSLRWIWRGRRSNGDFGPLSPL